MKDRLIVWLMFSLAAHAAMMAPLSMTPPRVEVLSAPATVDLFFEEASALPTSPSSALEQLPSPMREPEPPPASPVTPPPEPTPERAPEPEPEPMPVSAPPPVPPPTLPESAPEPAPEVAPPVEKPAPVARIEMPPSPRAFNRPPIYPRAARRAGQEGALTLALTVTARGLVEDVRIVKSSGYEVLDQEAIRAVCRWEFTPARRGEEKVSARIVVPVRFVLRD
jgi:protein TonB